MPGFQQPTQAIAACRTAIAEHVNEVLTILGPLFVDAAEAKSAQQIFDALKLRLHATIDELDLAMGESVHEHSKVQQQWWSLKLETVRVASSVSLKNQEAALEGGVATHALGVSTPSAAHALHALCTRRLIRWHTRAHSRPQPCPLCHHTCHWAHPAPARGVLA
jgi:hypothetical protein